MQQVQNTEVEEVFEDKSKVINKGLKLLKETLNDAIEVFEKGFRIQTLIPSNPQLALYGLTKLHKKDIPIIPIVSGINTTFYKLAQHLN